MKVGNHLILQPNQGIQNNANTGALKGFIVSVGQGISKMGNAISNFFQNTLPNFFKSLSERLPSIGSPPQPRLHSLMEFEDFANQPLTNDDDGHDQPLDLSEFPSRPSISDHQQLMNETKLAYQNYNKNNLMNDAKDYLDDPIDEEIVFRRPPKKTDEVKEVEVSNSDVDKLFEETPGSKDLPGNSSPQISAGGRKDISQDLESLLNELAEEVKEPENGGTLHKTLNEEMKKMVEKSTEEVMQEITQSKDLPKGVRQDIIKILGESRLEQK
ncbi:MAG: hypothetical protein ACO1TE_18195 [Prosthecobacter sp.]